MAKYQGSHKWKPEWADPVDVQRWLERELFVGETLNFPCGQSQVGDVRADIDPDNDPDVIADLLEPLEAFSTREFDTVYCDPPFSLYGYRDGVFWPKELYQIADKRLILQTPKNRVVLSGAEKQWRICEPKPGSPSTGVMLFQVFDRPDSSLEVTA